MSDVCVVSDYTSRISPFLSNTAVWQALNSARSFVKGRTDDLSDTTLLLKMAKSVNPMRVKRLTIYIFVVLLMMAIGITVGLVLLHFRKRANEGFPWNDSESKLGNFSTAAVVTDGKECAEVGKVILEKNGSAVDAAIATLLCMGVVIPHSSGIGGGFLMTIYEREKGTVRILDARETAPEAATSNMYDGDPDLKRVGGLAVAVPGELRGYELAHEKYGRLNWSELFEPAIRIARQGFAVGKHLASAIKQHKTNLEKAPELKKLLTNPKTKDLYQRDDIMKNLKLANTLERIAESGNASVFYQGEIGKELIETIRNDGGIMTMDDLASYEARWLNSAISVQMRSKPKLTLYSVPPPGSGAILAMILNILSQYEDEIVKLSQDPGLAYHRLIEAYKFAFARRMLLEDRDDSTMRKLLQEMTSDTFAQEIRQKINDSTTYHDPAYYGASGSYSVDHGTAHVSVVAPNGDAVSASTTINLYFGSRLACASTGVILNDEMDDFNSPNITNAFGVPPSDANLIVPRNRPQSSMAPAILVDEKGEVKMSIGGAGGTQITTGIASVVFRAIWLGQDIKSAIDAPRIHHQLFPNTSIYEAEFSKDVLESLVMRNHIIKELTGRGAVIQGIVRGDDGLLYANSDYRKQGSVDGF